jgi:hypothetical protein
MIATSDKAFNLYLKWSFICRSLPYSLPLTESPLISDHCSILGGSAAKINDAGHHKQRESILLALMGSGPGEWIKGEEVIYL